mmetsp:Transcript_43637/g.83268  ORF Transcript_43637/g.83268 Transcript_43637/m.83268 type:complete len:362 (+) Transcript_43637:233-1318(+)|eukprot:CAMPEP_0114263440 /NCGR_PEP_ID=MMETSP0058-20121206/22509_1 /TAXON_ID=36894 /ORGANISM="Pyramimonas parkeae, CCMP726" /LENGTH=361 /DNA_ID=CAMNT_0001379717 /DNA_START=143 /DNA_END=1228 /DNA_ORIENTATION=+
MIVLRGGYGTQTSCLEVLEQIQGWEKVISFMSVMASLTISVPQIYKIYRLKSAQAVSFWTLAMGNLGGQFYVVNMFILHYDQILAGWHGTQQQRMAMHWNLMMLYVVVATTVSYSLIYPVALAYQKSHRMDLQVCAVTWQTTTRQVALAGLTVQVAASALGWAPAFKMVLEGSTCGAYQNYASGCGILVSIFALLQFFPQLYASYQAKGAHALSYFTLGGDMSAGTVCCLEKIYITKERVSSWFPPLVGHALELSIIIMNLYFDLKRPPLSQSSTSTCRQYWVQGEGGVIRDDDDEFDERTLSTHLLIADGVDSDTSNSSLSDYITEEFDDTCADTRPVVPVLTPYARRLEAMNRFLDRFL